MLKKIQKFFERNPKFILSLSFIVFSLCSLWIFYTNGWGGLLSNIFMWVFVYYLVINIRKKEDDEIKYLYNEVKEVSNKTREQSEETNELRKRLSEQHKSITEAYIFVKYLETTNSHTHHSLKNAVDRIDGIIENLEVGNFTEQDLESLKKGTKNLLDALEIVKKFGKSTTQNDFPIGELVDVISILHKSHTKKIDFEVVYEKVLPTTEISMNWYSAYQVFDNLLINAYEAIANQPKKHIQLFIKQEDDNFLTFWICDTGIGITKENENQLFNLGFSTKISEQEKPRGIGLNHIQHIVTESKGNISYKGGDLEFSTIFELKLPIKQ